MYKNTKITFEIIFLYNISYGHTLYNLIQSWKEGDKYMREFVDVEWLMESKMFQDKIRLIAGHGGLKRRVTYVTVQEAPNLYEQIEGGEFVLSAWYAFKDDVASGINTIRNLSRKASGLCIKLNRFIKTIPNEYIECANQTNFPLFVVDEDVKFRDIIKNITLEINSAQTNVLIDLKDYYTYLFKATLDNGSADTMLSDFSKRLGMIAISISTDYRQIRGLRSLAKLPDYEYRLRKIKSIIQQHSIQQNGTGVEYFSDNEYHIFPCIARGYCYGYFVVLSKEALSERQRLYITQLVNIITIKWLDRQEQVNSALLDMLEMICKTPVENEKQISSFLSERNIDCTSGLRVVHLEIRNKCKTKVDLSIFQRFLLDVMAFRSNVIYIWDKANSFNMLIDGQERDGHICVKKFKDFSNIYTNLIIALGPTVTQINNIRESLRVATNLVIFTQDTNFVYYRDYLMHIAIIGGATSFESQLFLSETIAQIELHDKTYHDSVLETLINVVKYESLEVAAKAQNMHVNSIRYRLTKIKKFLDIDYFTPTGRNILTNACILYHYRNKILQIH